MSHRPLDIDELRCREEDQEEIIKFLENKIKFLEDNAFSDRARIGVLENKIEELTIKD